MVRKQQLDANPYRAPQLTNSSTDNDWENHEPRVPGWLEVVTKASIVSVISGSIVSISLMTNWIALGLLFAAVPVSFSRYFVSCYDLVKHEAPKLFWLFPAVIWIAVFVATVTAVVAYVGPEISGQLFELDLSPGRYLSEVVFGSACLGILCLSLDSALSLFVDREMKFCWTILLPIALSFCLTLLMMLLKPIFLPLLMSHSTRTLVFGILLSHNVAAGAIVSCGVFYGLIRCHFGIRARLVRSLQDPRRFARGTFKLN